MPYQETTVDFDDEFERLESRRKTVAEEAASLDEGNPLRQQKVQEGMALDKQVEGVAWARDHAHEDDSVPVWDAPADGVVLGGLSGGEFARVEDKLASTKQNGVDVGSGALRIHNVAMGTVTAPYIREGMSLQEKVGAVSQLPDSYLRWASSKIDELTRPEGNGQRAFADLLRDAQEASN